MKGACVFQQWFAAFAVSMLVMQPGLMGGWSSPSLALLRSPESPIPLTSDQASWVAALVNSGRLLGAVLGAVFASFLGSKRTVFVTLWPVAVGWLLVILAKTPEWLYASRIISGVGLGMAYSVFPIYIGEVSMPEIRGALISLATMGAPIGQLIASVCGSYLQIEEAASVYLTLAFLLMFIFFWFPESPHHLVKKGQRKEALKAIHWYRGGRDVDKELENVDKFVSGSGQKSFGAKLADFKSPAIRRATFQIIALFTFMQICGLNSIIFYMETILKSANFTFISPFLVVIYVNICGIVAALISIVLIDRCGRRFLLVASSLGVTMSLLGLTGHFWSLNAGMEIPELHWVPMASMFLFVISFFAGLFPVPSAILSETFPADIKCIAASIASITGALMSFMSAKTYQPMVDYMGETYVFLIYAVCASLIIPFTLLVVPETKGKSLLQIQEELLKK